MALIDQVVDELPAHELMSALELYARNPFAQTAAVRRQYFIDAFAIPPENESHLDAFLAAGQSEITAIRDGLPAVVPLSIREKIAWTCYAVPVENAIRLGQFTMPSGQPFLTKPQVKTLLGF